MNFTEVVAEVLRIVKRPDKVLDVKREVNSVINLFSVDSFFPGDFVELSIPVADELTFSVPATDTPRLRSIKYIKYGGTRKFLTRINSSSLFDAKCDLRDTYYQAGTGIKINVTSVVAMLDIGYYEFPPILTDGEPNHWMLEGYWPMVVDKAAARVFNSLGDETSARMHEAISSQSFAAMRTKLTHWL